MVNLQNTNISLYKDSDSDGYSDGTTITQCTQPSGYKLASELKSTSGDCDDSNASKNPADNDKDGYSTCAGDCDDSPETGKDVYPGATEKCGDNKDNNCDGKTDEGCCEVNISASPSDVWPQKTGGNTEANIIVSLDKPAPPQGCTTNFSIKPVENSGGHKHDGSRPTGSLNSNTVSFSSGTSGVNSLRYTSSEVSGEEKIIAEVDGEKKDETMVSIRVPGLMSLGSSNAYNRTGSKLFHPSNHFGTSSTNSSVYNIAFDYLYETDTILGINDMSIEWGGLFDIDGNWRPPHNSHRVGESVDIDRMAQDTETWKYVKVNRKKLYAIAISHGGVEVKEPTIHYEFH